MDNVNRILRVHARLHNGIIIRVSSKPLTFYLAAVLALINFYYLAFIIGMVFADIFSSKKSIFKTDNRIVLFIIMISGLFLGSYPVSPLAENSVYGFLNNGFFRDPKMTYHIIGAGMVMYVLLNSIDLQKVFLPVCLYSSEKYPIPCTLCISP